MTNKSSTCWTASNILQDSLTCQKYLSTLYNTAVTEASTPSIRTDFCNILSEVHQLQNDVFTVMQQKGLYMTPPAPQQEVTQAWQKYSSQQQ